MQLLINEFQEIIRTTPERLQTVTAAAFSAKTRPEKWSKKQILGHLIDSAANNHHRFVRIQHENNASVSYDQDQWNRLSHYDEASIDELIQLWTLYNLHLLRIIKNIPAEDLLKTGFDATNTSYALKWCIEDYVRHLKHHLEQILGDCPE